MIGSSKQLHGNVGQYKDIHPDVVVIYIGINDIRNSQSLSEFEKYYREVINNVDNKNPKVQIYIMTHVPFTWTDDNFMVKNENDIKILEQYNDVIRKIANESNSDNCYLVDYYKKGGITISNHLKYANDGLHPNAYGMDKITSSIISSLVY